MLKSTKKPLGAIAFVALAAGVAAWSLAAIASDPKPEFPPVDSDDIALVTVGDGFMDFDLNVQAESAMLRVTGPDGYALSLKLDERPQFVTADLLLDASPSRLYDHDLDDLQAAQWDKLPEGQYSYELMVYTGSRSPEIVRGHFNVVDGSIQHDGTQSQAPQATEDDHASSNAEPGWLMRIAGATLDLIVPSAQAQSVTADNFVFIADQADDNNTRVNFEQTNFTNLGVQARDGNFNIARGTGPNFSEIIMHFNTQGKVGLNTTSPQELFHIVNPDQNAARLRIENTQTAYNLTTGENTGFAISQVKGGSGTPFRIEPGAPTGSIRVSSAGNVGIGTTSPTHPLHVAGDTRLDNVGIGVNATAGNTLFVRGETGQDPFRVQAGGGGTTRFLIAENGGTTIGTLDTNPPARGLYVFGDTGIGTSSPASPLHVRQSNNTANVRVEDTGSGSPQVMFQLLNNGFPQFNMQDTSQSNVNWTFRLSGNAGTTERFTITKLGTGAAEFELFHDGSANFRGDVTANGVLLNSAREAKTDFAEINTREILNKLAALDITQWRYKHEEEGTVHIGPIAEEFHELFGLSNGKTLNMIDTNGITFAAIKALNDENQKLANQNQELVERLERLESLVSTSM